MALDIEARMAALLDQLNDSLTETEVDIIERKIGILRDLQDDSKP